MGLDLHLYFKGKLFTNAAEKGLKSTLQSINYSALMHEMYESRRGVYRDWSKDKSVCFDCLEQFFLKTLPFWWLDRKRKGTTILFSYFLVFTICLAKTPIMRDCWWVVSILISSASTECNAGTVTIVLNRSFFGMLSCSMYVYLVPLIVINYPKHHTTKASMWTHPESSNRDADRGLLRVIVGRRHTLA